MLRMLNKNRLATVDENTIFAAIVEQRVIVDRACKVSAAARRQRAKASAGERPSAMISTESADIESGGSITAEKYSVDVTFRVIYR